MINIDQLCSTLPLQNPAKSTKVVHRTSLYLALGQQMSRHLLINLSQKLEERNDHPYLFGPAETSGHFLSSQKKIYI